MTVVERSTSRVEQRARLASVMERLNLGAVVITSYQGVSYYAGTNIITQVALPERLEFFILFGDGSPALLLCNIETGMAKSQTDITDVSEYVEFLDEPAAALANLLTERGNVTGRIGIESRRLHAEAYEHLTSALPQVEFVSIDGEVERTQSVKTSSEIEMLRHAAQTTLQAVLDAAAKAKPGDSELAVCSDICSQLMTNGGIYGFMVFGAGPRALGAHVEATSHPLQEGEIWRIDLGARFFDVINSDLARVGIVGEPSSRQTEVMAALHAIQHAGFETIEPGRPAREVFAAVKGEYARQGLPFSMPHVGHGLGIGLHEAPILEPANDSLLEPGMVLNVEPMVVLADDGECYHTEDLALVTKDGYELLTTPQEALISISG
jgi:Xaa-Pro dipeptidase